VFDTATADHLCRNFFDVGGRRLPASVGSGDVFILKGEGLATCDGKSVASWRQPLVPPGTHKMKILDRLLIRSVYYGAE